MTTLAFQASITSSNNHLLKVLHAKLCNSCKQGYPCWRSHFFFFSFGHLFKQCSHIKTLQCRILHLLTSSKPMTLSTGMLDRLHLQHELRRLHFHAQMLTLCHKNHVSPGRVHFYQCEYDREWPTWRMKQGCTLSPLFFCVYVYDADCIVEGKEGDVTGAHDVQVQSMLMT